MNVDEIKGLIESFSKEGLTELKLKCETFELKLEKSVGAMQQEINPPKVEQKPMALKVEEVKPEKSINSPIVGVFYAASSPNAEPFVQVGQKVKKGEVVCLIEAMKLMNEVEAEEDGEIVEVLVQNEEMVEFGQPLFVLK